jgi:CNT family concentrative nucleoside transporter
VAIVFVWNNTCVRAVSFIPEKFRLWLGALGAIAVIVIGTFTSPVGADNTHANRAVSLFGLLVFILLFYATSHNRAAINWHTVIVGMLAQFILALFVLRTQAGYDIFNFVAFLATSLLGYSAQGTTFLLNPDAFKLGWFIINVIPPIIFFVAFVQLLYYWGWLQWAIGKFAFFFFWSMRVSGAEAVVAAASPFVGQGESAMLIRPFIPHLTDAEIHQVMTSGFATIAGSVLAAYISFGVSPTALISSCVIEHPGQSGHLEAALPGDRGVPDGRNSHHPRDRRRKAHKLPARVRQWILAGSQDRRHDHRSVVVHPCVAGTGERTVDVVGTLCEHPRSGSHGAADLGVLVLSGCFLAGRG